jgi:hypothetical protein
MKRDLIFIVEKLVSVIDETQVEILARQHVIRQKRDDGGIAKTFGAFLRRADEGMLSRLLMESSWRPCAATPRPSSRMPLMPIKWTATPSPPRYGRSSPRRKRRRRRRSQQQESPRKWPNDSLTEGRRFAVPSFCSCAKIAQGETLLVSPCNRHPATGPRSPAARQESSSETITNVLGPSSSLVQRPNRRPLAHSSSGMGLDADASINELASFRSAPVPQSRENGRFGRFRSVVNCGYLDGRTGTNLTSWRRNLIACPLGGPLVYAFTDHCVKRYP